VLERGLLRLEGLEVDDGEGEVVGWGVRVDPHHPVGVGIRHRTQVEGVHHREDDGAARDPEPEGRHDRQGENRGGRKAPAGASELAVSASCHEDAQTSQSEEDGIASELPEVSSVGLVPAVPRRHGRM